MARQLVMDNKTAPETGDRTGISLDRSSEVRCVGRRVTVSKPGVTGLSDSIVSPPPTHNKLLPSNWHEVSEMLTITIIIFISNQMFHQCPGVVSCLNGEKVSTPLDKKTHTWLKHYLLSHHVWGGCVVIKADAIHGDIPEILLFFMTKLLVFKLYLYIEFIVKFIVILKVILCIP